MLVLPKSNRDSKALLIIIPLMIVNLLWLLFKKILGMPSSQAQHYDMLFQSLAIGIAVLWLIAPKLGGSNGFVRFCLSLGILTVVAGLGTLSYYTVFSGETAIFIVLLIFMSIVLLLAMAITGWLCKRKYLPIRYMIGLAFFILLESIVALIVAFIIGTWFIFPGKPKLMSVIFDIARMGLIFGICLYVLNLPFMILGFANPFFRERLITCLRLKSTPTTVPRSNPHQPYQEEKSEDGGSV